MRRARLNPLLAETEQKELRPLRLDDLMNARREVTRTEDQSADYLQRQRGFGADAADSAVPFATDMEPIMQFLAQIASNASARRT